MRRLSASSLPLRIDHARLEMRAADIDAEDAGCREPRRSLVVERFAGRAVEEPYHFSFRLDRPAGKATIAGDGAHRRVLLFLPVTRKATWRLLEIAGRSV